MSTTTKRPSTAQLEADLRRLDAAESTDLDPRTDERARSTLARIVSSSDGPVPAGTPSAVPSLRTSDTGAPAGRTVMRSGRPLVRRVVAVGLVAAALAAGSIVAPSLFGADQAIAWSARPQTLSPDRAREAQEACDASVRDTSASLAGADLSGLRPVITELRGSLVLVYETDSKPAPSDLTCYVRDGKVVASGGSAATPASEPLPPLPANSLHGDLGAVFSTAGGSIRGVTGQVGSDVVGVALDSVAQGPVTATVREGHFAAWWPDLPTTEAKENAATAPEITGATVTLRDGTTRQVSVEELSGRTSEELLRPDIGGSDSAG